MKLAAGIRAAQASGDLKPLIGMVPYFRWLGLRAEWREKNHDGKHGGNHGGKQDGGKEGEQGSEIITILPFQDMLIGNPMLPALHGGVTGALLESAAMVSLIGTMKQPNLPRIINFTVEYLRPGRPEDCFATGIVTKQGRRVATVRAMAWQRDREKLFATASAHFMMT